MRKNFFSMTIVAVAFTGALLVLGSSTSSSSVSAPCEETMEQCCKKKSESNADNMIWETVSGQFSTSLN